MSQVESIVKASLLDFYGQTGPVANPPAFEARLFYDEVANQLKCINSLGTSVIGGGGASVNPQSSGTAAYQAVIGDANQVTTMSSASASTFTIPANATVAFPVGTTLTVIQLGTGQITLTAAGGVTLYTPSSATTRAQYSTVAVIQVSANVWIAGGDLT